jgi:glutaredoxin 3
MSISIYTKTGCPYCQAFKDWLKSRGKEYEEINLSLCPDKIEEMLRVSGGARKVPVIIHNGQVTVGFNGRG